MAVQGSGGVVRGVHLEGGVVLGPLRNLGGGLEGGKWGVVVCAKEGRREGAGVSVAVSVLGMRGWGRGGVIV